MTVGRSATAQHKSSSAELPFLLPLPHGVVYTGCHQAVTETFDSGFGAGQGEPPG